MAINPALRPEQLNNPTQRASQLNDPQFENTQGYFPYDLTHAEYLTTRFGEITPCMHLDTAPCDRTVVHDSTKTILNQINGNLLSTVNQYVDSFYIPLRSVFPTNYEKLIPNPTKGDDLPHSAKPQIPFYYWLSDILGFTGREITVHLLTTDTYLIKEYYSDVTINSMQTVPAGIVRSILLYVYTMLSRGQLMDYLGYQFDSFNDDYSANVVGGKYSYIQEQIDNWFQQYWLCYLKSNNKSIRSLSFSLTDDLIDISEYSNSYIASDKSDFRRIISDILERGELPYIVLGGISLTDEDLINFYNTHSSLATYFYENFTRGYQSEITPNVIDNQADPFANGGFLNIAKVLAYQQVVAHYFSNNSVDNVFSSELFMQNLRGIMFPQAFDNVVGVTHEPVFEYNGVATEYDYISSGAWYMAFMYRAYSGSLQRSLVAISTLFLLRRSLRYGDYFATARPNLLAVGQLNINVTDGAVSPIDVTKNLLMQRYLNAANYTGSRFLQFFASFYGVTPSDTGTFPRFLAHRKVELQNQITNNTSDNQGYQTTNIVGYSDDNAFDVFIDDFGIILSLMSYDVLPVYLSGIDPSAHFSDRFDYFNPMLQGIGDQPIRFDELVGDTHQHNVVFGYTMRNAEYKYKNSRAHGGFANSLPGFLFKYPLSDFYNSQNEPFHISPNFIRDKPAYMDAICPSLTGVSPSEYFHFVVACVNQVHSARKIQATPPVLF